MDSPTDRFKRVQERICSVERIQFKDPHIHNDLNTHRLSRTGIGQDIHISTSVAGLCRPEEDSVQVALSLLDFAQLGDSFLQLGDVLAESDAALAAGECSQGFTLFLCYRRIQTSDDLSSTSSQQIEA